MRKAVTSPGIAGNDLNRCDAPALQRKDLEQRLKEQLYSLVDSRLRVVEMGGGGQKELLWMAIKKVCAKARLLVCENGRFLKSARKGLCKRKAFCT